MKLTLWMAAPLLAALGCDPCPHHKCLGPPGLLIHVVAADTGRDLVATGADAGASAHATAVVVQDGVTQTTDTATPLTTPSALGAGVGAGSVSVTVSAPGYQTAQQTLTFTETQCGGVTRQVVTFTLVPEQAAAAQAALVVQGGSTVCGEE